MISSSDFRTGATIEIDNNVWQIVDFQHVKPGKGAAFVRTKMKNVRTGAVVERTFNPGEKFPKAHVDRREMQYLYESDGNYNFMDNENYEQSELTSDQLGDAVKYLKENMNISIMFFQGTVIGVELPVAVELTVVETDPGIRGDTATGGTKPAKMESGCVVRVPLFINIGDVLRVDTRTGEYLERA
ncbi:MULTISPECIES: elongation factor P [Pelosinus]|uniref:Elongation factor P n=1 Tax=Pelosinus fermentans B4 TaxID=1149862 RepID=I9LDB4_9FIRM|nr:MULTISPECIES: elongation factor P [Pelosinus]EIW18424.1 translation elongation factor P [Pelosinus fermentans B4]EIW24438.1 Elongation factor P [Pelosinus fermentans A11]OAM94504.1 Elongation factor P [Pelosinus fermentans DSM 17108]SDR10807.1 elongation factor P [Pelosinus fermentans]